MTLLAAIIAIRKNCDRFVRLTTGPYAYIASDALNVQSTLTAVTIEVGLRNIDTSDALNWSNQLSSAVFESIFKAYDNPAEAINVANSLTAVDIAAILKTYDNPVESLNVASTLTAVEIKVVLVTMQPTSDSLNVSSTLTGVTFL